ncbi:hypothetical protein PG995_008019 [Apiospora arundinis]
MDGPPRKKHISAAVVYANCEGLDDAKAKKTATNWFHQLPEEIIMRVIHSIRDKVSILILRQTCRQFKRLCEDPTLEYRLPILLNKARSTASSYKHKHIFSPVEDELRIYESPDHDPSWLVALDPDSYLSDSDELTRGLMWCRDPTCAITKGGADCASSSINTTYRIRKCRFLPAMMVMNSNSMNTRDDRVYENEISINESRSVLQLTLVNYTNGTI